MRQTMVVSLLSAVLAAGCMAPAGVAYSASVTTPDLVTVGPGVRVIADYDEPIFFADGYYWWMYDGLWYRSSYYTDGWVYVATPPLVITRIARPHDYRHYRPAGYVHRNRPVPVNRVRRPAVRDHRARPAQRQRPVVRDHRR
jgi:hypothetical protein